MINITLKTNIKLLRSPLKQDMAQDFVWVIFLNMLNATAEKARQQCEKRFTQDYAYALIQLYIHDTES